MRKLLPHGANLGFGKRKEVRGGGFVEANRGQRTCDQRLCFSMFVLCDLQRLRGRLLQGLGGRAVLRQVG